MGKVYASLASKLVEDHVPLTSQPVISASPSSRDCLHMNNNQHSVYAGKPLTLSRLTHISPGNCDVISDRSSLLSISDLNNLYERQRILRKIDNGRCMARSSVNCGFLLRLVIFSISPGPSSHFPSSHRSASISPPFPPMLPFIHYLLSLAHSFLSHVIYHSSTSSSTSLPHSHPICQLFLHYPPCPHSLLPIPSPAL